MPASHDFVDFILELLAPLGGIKSRAMFGGYGIYYDGIMVGLIAGDGFYLKVDDENRPLFEEAGSRPFSYRRKNRSEPIEMSYWEVPPKLFDERDVLFEWVQGAHGAAERSRDF